MVRWLLIGLAVIALILRIWTVTKAPSPYKLGDRVRITAVARGEPIRLYRKTYVTIEGITIEVPAETQIEYGDRIRVVGTVTSRVTEIRESKFGLINEDFQLIPGASLSGLWLQKLRLEMISKLGRWLPRDEASLAAGILLGGDKGMSWQLQESFRRTGMTHVIAASGYNVSVVAGWTMLFFTKWLPRKLAIVLGMGSIVFYVLLAGATAAVIRAGIMAGAAWTGQLWGREADSFWLLGVAAWVMLMLNPAYLADIGWQLSFAATVGIFWFRPTGDFWTSLSAQATTLPLILHHFGNLSVVAPIANLLLLWVIAPVMQITAVGLIIGPANWLAWPLLRLMTGFVTFLGNLSWSSLEVGKVSWLWVVVYFLVLVLISRYKVIVNRSK